MQRDSRPTVLALLLVWVCLLLVSCSSRAVGEDDGLPVMGGGEAARNNAAKAEPASKQHGAASPAKEPAAQITYALPAPGSAGATEITGAGDMAAAGDSTRPQLTGQQSGTGISGMLEKLQNRWKLIMQSPTFDLYIPVNTWHNRLAYSSKEANSLNEFPAGLGIGRSMYDEGGDWHGLYIIAFADSNNHMQPGVGYSYLYTWKLDDPGDWKVGLGVTATITARQEYAYVPIPAVLPLAGIAYKRFSIQTAYIPGWVNNWNLFFTTVRWEFGE